MFDWEALASKKLFSVLSKNILALSQDLDHHPYLMNCLQSFFLLMFEEQFQL